MPESAPSANPPKKLFKLHTNVFYPGLTSLLNDFSRELIFTLLPLFLTNILGASTMVVGFSTRDHNSKLKVKSNKFARTCGTIVIR